MISHFYPFVSFNTIVFNPKFDIKGGNANIAMKGTKVLANI